MLKNSHWSGHRCVPSCGQCQTPSTDFARCSKMCRLHLHAQIRPVVADLERAVCASGKRSRLVLIGSIASGMAFDESADINLAFFYAVLSPDIVSHQTLGGAIFSPVMLSPAIFTHGYLMVSIFSPSFLS
uniref:Uncharacterized protein n=1 Tax=Globodera rostochiensis TaxID=31243 RepID=A0A914HLS9_GLORO